MLRTKSGLPKHCSWNIDRHGKRRVRFRKGAFSTYLTGIPWSDDFMRAYAAALEGIKTQADNIGASRALPGTINALAVRYYGSEEFRGLSSSTQLVRRNIIERFRREHGDKPIARLERGHIKDIIGARAETPEAANNLLKVLRVLLAYAVSIDMMEHNPAVGVKRYKSRADGFHTWSEDEIAAFETHHPIGSKPRLALALLLYTAQRVSDVTRMGYQHIRGDRIAVRQQKTDAPLLIPMHPELMRILASAPRDNLTFLISERGEPFAGTSFSNWFGKCCREAGLKGCTAHGLRKAACRRLAEAGCSVHEIAAISGHKTLKEIERYTREADQARLASQALDRQLRAEREQELSNLETRLDKNG
jgi:integrase